MTNPAAQVIRREHGESERDFAERLRAEPSVVAEEPLKELTQAEKDVEPILDPLGLGEKRRVSVEKSAERKRKIREVVDAAKLQPMQKKFVIAFLKHGQATIATIEAGYSGKTAAVIGSQLLSKPKIADTLSAVAKVEAESKGVTPESVTAAIARIAFAEDQAIPWRDRLRGLEMLGKATGIFQEVDPDTGKTFVQLMREMVRGQEQAKTRRHKKRGERINETVKAFHAEHAPKPASSETSSERPAKPPEPGKHFMVQAMDAYESGQKLLFTDGDGRPLATGTKR